MRELWPRVPLAAKLLVPVAEDFSCYIVKRKSNPEFGKLSGT